jgi:cytidylate kinase
MIATGFLPRQAEALEHFLGYRGEVEVIEAAPARTALDGFTIALSREVGTPAVEVARETAARLGWSVYDRDIPARIAEELHLPLAVVEEIDERQPSWLLECIEAFSSRSKSNDSRYFRCLTSLIRALGEQGRAIILGRGAAFLLPARSTLRVRLVGDRTQRIAALARRFHLNRWNAARQLEEVHREHCRFIREHFHVDPSDPDHYDLLLNTSQWSIADCADFIVKALRHKAREHRQT